MRKKSFMKFKDHEETLARKAVAIKSGVPGPAAETPTIHAKGRGYRAEKILDLAFANDLKVREDKDLVELLDLFDVDCPIPLEALHTVSLILEKVYSANEAQIVKRADKAAKPEVKTP